MRTETTPKITKWLIENVNNLTFENQTIELTTDNYIIQFVVRFSQDKKNVIIDWIQIYKKRYYILK